MDWFKNIIQKIVDKFFEGYYQSKNIDYWSKKNDKMEGWTPILFIDDSKKEVEKSFLCN